VSSEFGVDTAVVEVMSSFGTNPSQLHGMDASGRDIKLPGVTVDVPAAETRKAVHDARLRMPPGYFVFVREMRFNLKSRPDLVAVMKANDQFAVIEGIGTDGANYNLRTSDVIARLKVWNDQFGLLLLGADVDWLEAEFIRVPPNMAAFAAEVYEFCPDVVDQGTETVSALANEMSRSNSVYLWWD
jgi:hypothetical protein